MSTGPTPSPTPAPFPCAATRETACSNQYAIALEIGPLDAAQAHASQRIAATLALLVLEHNVARDHGEEPEPLPGNVL